MSTILKALRRLEQEKSARSDRPLSEAVANTPAPPTVARSFSPWLIAGGSVAAAFLVTVAVLWFLNSGGPSPTTDTVASARAPGAEEPAAVPTASDPARRLNSSRQQAAQRVEARRLARAQENAVQPLDNLSPSALASEVEVVERKLIAPPAEADVTTPPPTLELPRTEPPRPGLAALRPRTTGSSPSDPFGAVVREPSRSAVGATANPTVKQAAAGNAPAPQPIPESAASSPAPAPESDVVARPPPVRKAEPEIVVAAVVPPKPAPPVPVVEAPVPKPADPPRRRAAPPAPEIFVARTIWHPLADRRVAVVEYGNSGESVEIREGDVIGTFVVGEIEPSGVNFIHNGVELRRRVGAR